MDKFLDFWLMFLTQNAISATISQSLDLEVILNAALDRALAVLGME